MLFSILIWGQQIEAASEYDNKITSSWFLKSGSWLWLCYQNPSRVHNVTTKTFEVIKHHWDQAEAMTLFGIIMGLKFHINDYLSYNFQLIKCATKKMYEYKSLCPFLHVIHLQGNFAVEH